MSKPNRLVPGEVHENLVVGGGLAGLATAACLLKAGRKVTLAEKGAQFGGRFSPERRAGSQFGSGFGWGDGEALFQLIEKLEIPQEWVTLESAAALLHGTKGWSPAADLPVWEDFLVKPSVRYPVGGLAGLMQNLERFCQGYGEKFRSFMDSPVTSLEVGANGSVGEIGIGGGSVAVRAENVFWCSPGKDLLEALQGEGAPEAGPARVAWLKRHRKTHATPGVVLEFVHKGKIADFTETLVLPFNQQDGEKERRYLVGNFASNRDPGLASAGKQLSQWICALSDLEWSDNHETMKRIRSARRLIEKAFVGFEGGVEMERVQVLEHTVSPLAKAKSSYEPLFANMFAYADWASPQGGHVAGVAELLLENFDSFAAKSAE